MEGFYTLVFALLSIVCLLLEWPRAGLGGAAASKAGTAPLPASFTGFRNNYLVVYSLMMGASLLNPCTRAGTGHTGRSRAGCQTRGRGALMPPARPTHPCADVPRTTAGDWLQGPYVYALYAGYGFSKGDIGKLFIAGFGSSMVFGTVVGSLADKQCVGAGCGARGSTSHAYRPRARERHATQQPGTGT